MDYKGFYSKIKHEIFTILLIGFAFSMQAQKHFDYNWLFGYGTGIPDSTNPFGGIIMSFSNNKISFIPQARDFEFYWQTNSFSNKDGELRLMSNGCSIANLNAEILKNGDSISYGKIWGVNCPKNQPSVQAGTFIHFGRNDSFLIFLHTILDTIDKELKVNRKAIFESKINEVEDSVVWLAID